ncbi:hypothetical protein NHX12_027817 [Muraenolepis orangiensis]|uniref:Dopamine beta-hydroxylase n=1 Tax=Muraenolepis orangiensis TaxID=630683 RepID=A0A9Q0IPL2_9TELE|nr:hypothetical protein NHX12_027817 [Muraenolepis orangiensis]
MYLTALATLVLILVAVYQAPAGALNPLEPSPLGGALVEGGTTRPPLPMPFSVALDPAGELLLSWNLSYATQEVYLELRVEDMKHGVLLGMSPRGELTNADLAVLWDDGHKSFFGQQDYQLLEAKHTPPHGFQLLFKRSFSTCDPRDFLIQDGTVHLIYGLLDRPMASLDQLNLSSIQTGVQRVLMLRPDSPAPSLPSDVASMEVLAPNVTVPTQETTYWCYIHKLAPRTAKNHIVMYEPVITRGNENLVHHMEVFECNPEVQDVPSYSGSHSSTHQMLVSLSVVLVPPDFYGRPDSSGIRLWFTPSLRRYDAGIMELGLVYTPLMAVPPKQSSFDLTGYCTAKCTQTAFPPGGINIFASQLHTHLAGRGVRTTTHYQTIRSLRKMVTVLPGDVLVTKCTYNTEDRSGPTVGGFSIMDEMCVNYVHYYPRTQLELCKTHVDPDHLQKYFSFMNRFHGREPCVCGGEGVTGQYSALQWDPFTSKGVWDNQPLPLVTTLLPEPRYPCEGGAGLT